MRLVTLRVVVAVAGAVGLPASVQAQLAPGDRVRIVTTDWGGDGIVQQFTPEHLCLSPLSDLRGESLRIPLAQVRRLHVQREVARSPSLARHLLVGALATGGVGAVVGAGTEYGSEAVVGLGLAFSLPGAAIGAAVWALWPRSAVRWEEVEFFPSGSGPVSIPGLLPPSFPVPSRSLLWDPRALTPSPTTLRIPRRGGPRPDPILRDPQPDRHHVPHSLPDHRPPRDGRVHRTRRSFGPGR